MAVPTYRIEATRGKAHEQTFVVACELPELSLSMSAEGLSRRAAEQGAAELLMTHLQSLPFRSVPSGKPTPKVVVKKSRKPQQG
jgi:ribonuclease-3